MKNFLPRLESKDSRNVFSVAELQVVRTLAPIWLASWAHTAEQGLAPFSTNTVSSLVIFAQ